jgi:DNA-directed RNA polymerase specialized sigma24 family protein
MDFPTTRWTEMAGATLHGDVAARQALANLCARYYEPVRQFIAWHGRAAQAADLTQSFFLYVLEQGVVKRADKLRGKFRTFLLTVLKRFLLHEDRAANAGKRGGGVELVALDDPNTPEPAIAPEEVTDFDRQWAVALMNAAVAQVGAEIVRERSADALDVLKHFLGTAQEPGTYETAANLLGMSLSAVKTEIMRWRRRLGELVRLEVARTVSAPHELREEIAYLRRILLE